MTLGRLSLITAVLLAFCVAASAGPVANVLDTESYNFQLAGGGGGATAQLNGSQNIELFCVDFANQIYVPMDYSAYLTTLTSGSNLNDTRFGSVTNWTTVNISGDSTDSSTINGATDLGRYQMAAYLISQYNLGDGATKPFSLDGSSTSNNGIQQAIWDILDPKGESFKPIASSSYSNTALEAAAQWYSATGGNSGSTARNNFLANFRIVSDATMGGCGFALSGCGFQEQITVVPEPRHLAVMLIGLLLVGSVAFRRLQAARRSDA